MTEQLRRDPHPDAELLNAFVEGVLPEHERVACVSHFAECDRCRAIVFLAQPPKSTEVLRIADAPWKRRWFAPIPAFGGVLAATVVIVAVILSRNQIPTVPAAIDYRAASKPPTDQPKREPARTGLTSLQIVAKGKKVREPWESHKPAVQESRNIVMAGTPPPLPSAAPIIASDVAKQQLTIGNDNAIDGQLSELKGNVTDASGAAISGATVNIRALTGKFAATARTDSSGQYTITALPAGKYVLEVQSAGFQKTVEQLEMKGRDVLIASTLKIGSAAETVVVVAGAEASVQTQTATTASTTSTRVLDSLPPVDPLVTTITNGAQSLALHSDGSLFSRKAPDKNWKAVKPKWQGKATQIVIINLGKPMFQLLTDSGAVWLSKDGVHWHPRPAEKN